MANEAQHNGYLVHYNNSQLVANAMQKEYVDSSSLADQDHVGWAKLQVQ